MTAACGIRIYTSKLRGGTMAFRVVSSVLLAIVLSLSLHAQRAPGGRTTSATTGTNPVTPPTSLPDLTSATANVLISGKVVPDDGSSLEQAATIELTCKGRKRSLGYTDSKGTFSFQLSATQQPQSINGPAPIDADTSGFDSGSRKLTSANWQDCELRADLAGFTSPIVELGPKINGDFRADIGNIIVHRIAHIEGYTISATSAAAPSNARKAYEKGVALEKKEKWDEAQQKFQTAVDAYPKFAEAWLELGRIQLRHSDESGAQHSFEQATVADAKFAIPYQHLAQLELKHNQWKELAQTTDHLLVLNSSAFPQYWFLSAVANYNLQNFDVAHKNALRGLAVDGAHRVPELEHVLAVVLIQKRDYKAAGEHLRNYLRLAPKGPDTDLAEKQLSELEKLEAEASTDEADEGEATDP
jgi:tetratricopeptide (TPR) repeat protein